MRYSFSKGLWKGAKSILMLIIPVISVTYFAEIDLWELTVTYVKPLLSGVSVLGALTMALNWVKVRAR